MQKKGCCSSFTSKRSGLQVEWCNKTMRYRLGKDKFQYFTIQGAKIKPEEFDGKSCMDMPAFKKGKAKVHVQKGGVTIAEKNKPTTTVTAKGKVINKNKDSKSTDTPKKNKTETPKETVKTSSANNDKVDSKKNDGKPKSTPSVSDAGKTENGPDAPADEGDAGAEDTPASDAGTAATGGAGGAAAPGDGEDEDPELNGLNPALKKKLKEKAVAENNDPNAKGCAPDFIIKSLGQYKIFIDKDNKVTIKTKQGESAMKKEKVVNA